MLVVMMMMGVTVVLVRLMVMGGVMLISRERQHRDLWKTGEKGGERTCEVSIKLSSV